MRTSYILAGILGLLLLYIPEMKAQFPAHLGKWQLRELGIAGEGRYVYPSGIDGQRVEGFGGWFSQWATYRQGREEVVVFLVEMDSRERAFGLFAAAAGDAARHGIVGDAFAMTPGARHMNYGPFYVYVRTVSRKSSIPEDLLVAMTRMLFNRADCYGTDIPLRMEDRILGSEQYFPPDMRAWGEIQVPGIEPVREILRGRSAWIAQYKGARQSDPPRWVMLLPVRHKEALNALEAGILDQYSLDGKVIEGCPLGAFAIGSTRVYMLPVREGLLLVLVSSTDADVCDWARNFSTGTNSF